ncbi:nucleotide disphospho-sugar-binding domain-containing protein [Variovorax humicola]|uniref:Nucleotide disphospho-sugar-binding domain-containing protein n=1 Tax=Variovorax humicola TaxID=1769758 RepID=A0ABU8VTW8_9BURK
MIALFPNCGFLSETSRMLAIARALQARGEPVAMATHGGPFMRVLESAGMPCTLLEPVMDARRCEEYLAGIVALGKPGSRLQTADEVRAGVRSEVEFLRAHQARMVVIGFTLTAYLSARVVGIPLAASHGGSYVPPVFEHGLAPAPSQSAIPGLDWLPDSLQKVMANASPPRMRGPVEFLNEVATELGVEPVPSLAALMLGDLTLVTDVPEVLGVSDEDMSAWRPNSRRGYRKETRLRYVGPLFARLDVPIPRRVQAFLDEGRPTAYVALSSSAPAFIRRVVAGVRAAGLRVVVAATIHELQDLEDQDVIVEGVLPSHLLMPRVAVALIMGGQGSVQTAMASGTPFVGFPLHPEQELNVALAARIGMVVAVGPRHADEARIRHAVETVTAQPAFAAAAARAQRLYAGVDGPGRAAEALLDYLRAPIPRAPETSSLAS